MAGRATTSPNSIQPSQFFATLLPLAFPLCPVYNPPPSRHRHEVYSLDPTTGPRKAHLRRLFDVLNLCLERNDRVRAQRAWAVLVRCPEVDLRELWTLGLRLMGPSDGWDMYGGSEARRRYLREMQGFHLKQSAAILLEYVFQLLAEGRQTDAFAELELYLQSLPYSTDAALHEYAGMLSVSMATRPTSAAGHQRLDDEDSLIEISHGHGLEHFLASVRGSPNVDRAVAYFEKALQLDPAAPAARGYLSMINPAK